MINGQPWIIEVYTDGDGGGSLFHWEITRRFMGLGRLGKVFWRAVNWKSSIGKRITVLKPNTRNVSVRIFQSRNYCCISGILASWIGSNHVKVSIAILPHQHVLITDPTLTHILKNP